MSTYTVAPQAYGSMILRVTRSLVHIAHFLTTVAATIVIIGSATWLYHQLFGGAPMTFLAEFQRAALEAYKYPLGLITVAVWLVVKSYSSRPHRFKVLIASDFVMIEGRWSWQNQYLRRSEVEYLRETPGGGYLSLLPESWSATRQRRYSFPVVPTIRNKSKASCRNGYL